MNKKHPHILRCTIPCEIYLNTNFDEVL